ncbi:hypothetical protein PsYK624_170760 [Phanerochaete sordida]|uniref:Uncharacterized protein n=1 Tax=Phanerochaete sordida TaxID=48140 RepID=A0A9P3GYP2_9APHY|nr:hypothetical protein PsYK624_170760 [Phanerochaete sordida]
MVFACAVEEREPLKSMRPPVSRPLDRSGPRRRSWTSWQRSMRILSHSSPLHPPSGRIFSWLLGLWVTKEQKPRITLSPIVCPAVYCDAFA